MLGPLSSLFAAFSARFPSAAIAAQTEVAAASRTIAAFEPSATGRTYEDRTASLLASLQGEFPVRRGAFAESYEALARDCRVREKPFYNEATYHIDRLLALEPWNDGENTAFEYTAYQVFEAILTSRDAAGFVLFLGVMAGWRGDRSLDGLEAMMRSRHMEATFGLVEGVFPASEKSFGYDVAARSLLANELFGPVRGEILRFLSTVILKRAGRLPAAGVGSGIYYDCAQRLVDAFGYGLAHRELGPRVRTAIRNSGGDAFGFLKLNRLVHLLMRREFERKISEFVPEEESILRRLFHKDAYAEAILGIDACLRTPERPNPPLSHSLKDLLEANPISPSKRLAAALGTTVFFESHDAADFLEMMEDANRPFAGNVEAVFALPEGAKGRAFIHVKQNARTEEAATAVHEFVHIEQERRLGVGWADRHVLEAEREALAVETWFRLANGDRRLYDVLAGLSPQGFESGLWIAVEQLYLRLKDVPA